MPTMTGLWRLPTIAWERCAVALQVEGRAMTLEEALAYADGG